MEENEQSEEFPWEWIYCEKEPEVDEETFYAILFLSQILDRRIIVEDIDENGEQKIINIWD